MLRSLKKFKNFDKVSEFRLINSFLVAIGMSLLGPILITLKGTLLLPWIISVFAIAGMLAVKSNDYFVGRFSIGELFKMGNILHIFFVMVACIYFINPSIMIYLDSVLLIIEMAVFSAYSIVLNNYITEHYPKDMSNFQIVRNSSWSDGALIGLSIITITTYFYSVGVGIVIFVIYNTGFSIWLFYNWNFYDDIE